MKLLVGLALLLSPLSLYASPFLVSDSYPAGLSQALMPVNFILSGLSANPITTAAFTNPDGTIELHYDLSTLGNGTYTVTAAAVNVFGGSSPASAPFTFTRGTPSTPTNLRIAP